MDITLNSFCTSHDKKDCHFQQQNKSVYLKRKRLLVTSEHRNQGGGYVFLFLHRRANEGKVIRKDGMALVLIPEGGLHSSR